ncbi:MAG: hypothetical protein ACYDCK_02775 [Thermoplasmatota archaeon]
MNAIPLDRFTTDKAFYGALKLHVYGTVHDSFVTTLLGGRSVVLNEEMKLEVGRFTARKADNLFVPQNGNRPKQSAEFYGFTSHKVREKLVQFHEAGIVELIGKGLRDAYTYKWKVPVKHWEICSFMRFRDKTADDPSLNLELYRLYLNRAFRAFSFRDFQALYVESLGEEFGQTRWGKRKFDEIAKSFTYEQFLKTRLDKLVSLKLVLADGADYRISDELRDALHHLDLFLHAVPYHPSRDMCDVCPLDDLCQAGSTQKLIVALNHVPLAGYGFATLPNRGSNGNGNGDGANGHSTNGSNGGENGH